MTTALFMLGVISCACQFIVICNFIYQLLFLCMFLASITTLSVDVVKPGLGLLCLLNLLLQDAPLSDCTESIEGLDLTEQAFSPAKSLSVRKVLPCHTALNTVVHPSFNLSLPLPFSSARNYLARKFKKNENRWMFKLCICTDANSYLYSIKSVLRILIFVCR